MTDTTSQLEDAARQLGITLDVQLRQVLQSVASDVATQKPSDATLVLGVSGAQGSGKTTFSELLGHALGIFHDLNVVTMSIDDFYHTKAEREALGRDVHPLCKTRGVPGTHDTALCMQTITDLCKAGPDTTTKIPAFSKLEDDRAAADDWPSHHGRPDIVILEGWCVGAAYRDPQSWDEPINALERARDPEGIWWRWSNAYLEHDYKALWAMLKPMLFIKVPGFQTVIESRIRQEETLVRDNPTLAAQAMSRAQIEEFVAHYERYTRQLLAEMPQTCDILIERDDHFCYQRLK